VNVAFEVAVALEVEVAFEVAVVFDVAVDVPPICSRRDFQGKNG